MHQVRLRFAVLSIAAMALLPVSTVRAQLLKGTILGTVSDQSHAVIPGVSVELTQVETNFQRTETTNDSGFFAFPNLDPGVYSIDIKHAGFKETRRAGIALAANTTVRADFELTPGEVTQVLEVTTQAAVCRPIAPIPAGKLKRGNSATYRSRTSGIIRTRL